MLQGVRSVTAGEGHKKIRVAVVESDPLRMIGYQSLLEGKHEIAVESASFRQIAANPRLDVVLLATHTGQNMFDKIAESKARGGKLRILLSGPAVDDETLLLAITAGAKGYIEESAGAGDFADAIKVVHSGSIWAPRRVLAMFVERAMSSMHRTRNSDLGFTEREREVLRLLVAGRSNKEIGLALKIEERTAKAHVMKLMRKVGAPNRIALTVQAVTRMLLD